MNIINDYTSFNFTVGRNGKTVDTIILHSTYGSFLGSVAWFKNVNAQASANYIISTEGEIRRIVNEANTSWNSGNKEWNERSISIEVTDNKQKEVTEKARLALIELVADIRKRYNIVNVKFHREIVQTQCPFADIKKEWLPQPQTDPLKECLSQHATLVSKLAAYEQKEKDWIATEKRLKEEKDQAIREMEAKVSRLLAEEKVKCQLEYKDKINGLTNEILFSVEKYKSL